ncbi:unnamed protein product [Cunninghamella blakesleeana]
MFTTPYITSEEASRLDSLKNKAASSTNTDTSTTSLFKTDANTGLFRTVIDPASTLPPYLQQSSLNTTINKPPNGFHSNNSNNKILPVERKIIASNDDSALPAFFIGAQQPKKEASSPSSSNDSVFDTHLNNTASSSNTIEASTSEKENKEEQPKSDNTVEEPTASSDKSIPIKKVEDIKTVKVFGYPRNSISLVLDRFNSYGPVEQHIITNDNIIMIEYETKSSANQALKDHGFSFNQQCKIGVILAEQNLQSITTGPIIPNQDKKDVDEKQSSLKLKRVEQLPEGQLFIKKKKGLGSGFAGISALGNRNISKQENAFKPEVISKYRDFFYEIFWGW